MLVTRPEPSLAGLALIATGIPVYFFWRKSARHGSLQKRKSVLRSG